MAGGKQSVRNDKPSIKFLENNLNGAFIELADINSHDYAPTSSESRQQNGKNPRQHSPDILSTRELVSKIGHVWDSATQPLSSLLAKSSSRYNYDGIQNAEILPCSTGERASSACISSDDEFISYSISSNRNSMSMMLVSLEYYRAIQKKSLLDYSGGKYSVLWRHLQGRSEEAQVSWDGNGIGSIAATDDFRSIYGWMKNVSFIRPKGCAVSAEFENHRPGDDHVKAEACTPAEFSISMSPNSSADNVIIGNCDHHISNNEKSALTEVRDVRTTPASTTALQVEDATKNLESVNSNTSILIVRSQTDNDQTLSTDYNCASDESKHTSRTEDVLCDEIGQLMNATEHHPASDICVSPRESVSPKESTHYMVAKQEHAVAGAMAGIFVSTCLHPVDTVKTIVQSCRANPNSLHHIGKSIISERGVTGLYRGISSNIASSAPISAIYTFTYESVKGTLLPLFPKEYQPLAHCMAGGCASIATSFVFTPSERIKQQMQVGSHYHNCWNALIKIIEKGGMSSLYAGWGAVLCRNVPHSIIKFFTYESLKQLMFPVGQSSVQSNTLLTLICGGLSGSTAALFTTPFDVVKTRLQTQIPGSINQYDGVLNTLKHIAKHEGLKGLYRGLTPRLFMYMTQGALFFTSYESFKRLFSLEVSSLNAQKAPGKQRNEDNSTSLPLQEHDSVSCLAN